MIATRIFQSIAGFSMRRVGQHFVPELPTYQLNPEALRPYTSEEEQMERDLYYKMIGHDRSHKELPQCRYFAVEHKNRVHHIFNAYYYPMGRMITKIATAIRGRNSPLYRNSQANIKNGDVCIIVNAVDPLFTGKKLLFKDFKYHTGFVGNLKTFSYKSVLNKKPELLYYYLLRKAMPKNKISEEYLENVKIFRGPTHNINNIPQFAPPKFMKDPLTEVDLEAYLQETEYDQLLFEADEKQSYLGKDLSKEGEERKDESFEPEQKKKKKYKYTEKELTKFQNLKKRILNRYKVVRAPYKKAPKEDPGYKMFFSEKEARNSPYYKELANEDLVEIDEQLVEDPLKRKGFDKE